MTTGQQYMALNIRRDAALKLEHAIARIGYWSDTPNEDVYQAAWIIQNAKWSLEAMDSPASNRFWDGQRNDYDDMLVAIGRV